MASQLVPILTNEATAARRQVYFHLVDAVDGITAETGEAGGQPQISTNGGAWTNTGIGTLSAIGNGEYFAEVTQSAVNITAGGRIKTRYKSANTAEARGDTLMIMGADPFLATIAANVTQIAGSATPANNLASILDGTGAVMTLTQLRINSTNANGAIDIDNSAGPAISARTSSGDAVEAVSTGGNGDGIAAAGNGTGSGIRADAGATGHGLLATGGATSGNGIRATAPIGTALVAECTGPDGIGLYVQGGTNAPGAQIAAGANGLAGMECLGGPANDGILAIGGDGGHGIYARSQNNGNGILAEGTGTNRAGLRCTGGAADASGIQAIGATTGHGIQATGGLTGNGIVATGGATTGSGIVALAPVSGNGLLVMGAGSNAGISATGGATSHGILATGGATSGDGIHAEAATLGDGIEAVGAGGGFDINADIQGSLSGSVASVTGNVGGNVTGSVGSVVGNVGGDLVGDVQGDILGEVTDLSTAALAQINAEVDTALSDLRLDELILNTASPITPTINSFWDRITSKDGAQTYDRATDSLEALADSGGGGLTAQQVRDAMKLSPTVGAPDPGSIDEHLDNINADTVAILADTNVIEPLVSTNLDATVSSRATPAQVNTEVDTALSDIRLDELIQNAAAPADPTADSFIDLITSKDAGQTFDRSTDSLEAIADSGGGGLTQQQVRDAMKLAPTAGAPAAGSVDEHLDDILADTAAMQPLVDVAISTRATPAQVNTEVDNALIDIRLDELIQNPAAPADPTADSFIDLITSKDAGQTFNRTTDSLEALADSGGGGLSQQQVRDSLLLAPSGVAAAGSIDQILEEIEGPGFNSATDSLEEIRDRVDDCCGASGGAADEVEVEGI